MGTATTSLPSKAFQASVPVAPPFPEAARGDGDGEDDVDVAPNTRPKLVLLLLLLPVD